MVSDLLRVITSPRSLFDEISNAEPDLKLPAVFITVVAAISGINGYYAGELTGKALANVMQGIELITAAGAAISAFVMTYIVWFLAAVLFFFMQRVFGGTGTLKRVAEVVGYGVVPLVLASVISLLLGFYYFPQMDIHPINTSDPQKIGDEVQKIFKQQPFIEFNIASTLLTIILLIWSVSIWSVGLETCSALSAQKAFMAAGIPTAVYILYSIGSLINTMGVI